MKMQPKSGRHVSRNQRPHQVNSEGLNWVFIVGGAVLTTFAIKVGCKLKQAFTANRTTVDGPNDLKGASTLSSKEKSEAYGSNSDFYSFEQSEDECCRSSSGNGTEDMKQASDGPMSKVLEFTLPLATIPAPEVARDRSLTSSAECLELSRRIFYSNSSESPCASECSSDACSKKEILQSLRRQLKKRDEMILEMQSQITKLQTSLRTQVSKSAELQSQFDLINFDLFESEREAQRLRKAVADHCVGDKSSHEKLNPSEHLENDYLHGFHQGDSNLELQVIDVDKAQKESLDGYEILKKEVQLKEVIEGKEFLLQTYKEQQAELHFPIKELQPRLAQ